MTTKDLIPNTQDNPDEHVWTVDELLEYLQRIKSTHGNIPVVGRGYEMGMDNLQPEVLKIYRGGEGVCGTFADSNWKDESAEGHIALALGNAG